MKTEQCRWTALNGWNSSPAAGADADLVLLFGGRSFFADKTVIDELIKVYPEAFILGCSTAGEIHGTEVTDETLVSTAISFASSCCMISCIHIGDAGSSLEAGQRLAQMLEHDGLVHVFVLSNGLNVNGSDLTRGLTSCLPAGVSVTGGLAGDADRFTETYVICGSEVGGDIIGVVGFYGENLHIGFGCLGGWDPFGPERLITSSEGNVLFGLDGISALELYKKYLGDYASELPASAMFFPLAIRIPDGPAGLVRTILGVDEEESSMTFAGDLPEGAYARFMRANHDRLIDGAIGAASASLKGLEGRDAELALLISCVGRKMVLKQRVEEEVEGVRDILGSRSTITGFYSYGEISPLMESSRAELHNQTMTITTFSED